MRFSFPTALFAAALVLASLIPLPMPAQSPTGIVSLAALRDRARPLLLFAPTPNDPALQIQLRRLHDHAADLTARDIVIIAIPFESTSPTHATLTVEAAQSVRHRFHIAPTDFVVILIGKDGGEKLRSTKPLTIDKLNETIDAMPMRQQEMRSHPQL
jgi:hypothetical protein